MELLLCWPIAYRKRRWGLNVFPNWQQADPSTQELDLETCSVGKELERVIQLDIVGYLTWDLMVHVGNDGESWRMGTGRNNLLFISLLHVGNLKSRRLTIKLKKEAC